MSSPPCLVVILLIIAATATTSLASTTGCPCLTQAEVDAKLTAYTNSDGTRTSFAIDPHDYPSTYGA